MIAIKTERTQIHFLSDVLVAVASLDRKVPMSYGSSDPIEVVPLVTPLNLLKGTDVV